MKLSRISWIIILFMIIVIATIIFLYRIIHINPSVYGSIGDSVSGLLTPFISLITIIFIYETFLSEKNKSKRENEKLETEFLNGKIERAHSLIDRFTYITHEYKKPITKKGNEPIIKGGEGLIGIRHYYDNLKNIYQYDLKYTNSEDVELHRIYCYVLRLFNEINKFEPTISFYKEDVSFNASILFSSKINYIINAFIENNHSIHQAAYHHLEPTKEILLKLSQEHNHMQIRVEFFE